MRRQLLCFVALLGAASPAIPASQDSAAVSLISIVLEKKTGDAVQTVDPTHVFSEGDTVRFRLTPSVDGYLYVMDLNTTGPPGYEKLYFLLSPAALTTGQVQGHTNNALPQGTAPASMRPRCNDEIFKARGDCVDATAGPKAVAPGEALPRDLTDLANGASRDLKFTNNGSSSTVSSGAPLTGPVVYEFLLAHK